MAFLQGGFPGSAPQVQRPSSSLLNAINTQTSIQDIFKQLQNQQSGQYAQALQYQKQLLKTIQGGYGQALGTLGQYGASSKQAALDRGTQQTGAAQSSLVGRGLFNTTTLDNAQRGINSDTQRALGAIDQTVAGMRSGLEVGKAGAEAQAYGGLSGLFQNHSAAQTQLGEALVQALIAGRKQKHHSGLGGFLGGLLGFVGSGGNPLGGLAGLFGGGGSDSGEGGGL